jgi:molecular chaperone GrpE (heat shock protein)
LGIFAPQVLSQKLTHAEKELKEKRDKLQRVKTERDKLRNEATRMKENSSYVAKDVLLEDVEVCVDILIPPPPPFP